MIVRKLRKSERREIWRAVSLALEGMERGNWNRWRNELLQAIKDMRYALQEPASQDKPGGKKEGLSHSGLKYANLALGNLEREILRIPELLSRTAGFRDMDGNDDKEDKGDTEDRQ